MLRRNKPEEYWNVWKEIVSLVSVLLFIAFGNLLYGRMIGIATLSFEQLALAILVTFLLGLFPITANVALKYNRFQVLNQKDAQQLEQEVKSYQQRLETQEIPEQKEREASGVKNEETRGELPLKTGTLIPPKPEPEPESRKEGVKSEIVTLIAENGKDKLKLNAADILYIESADNYSEIVFLKNGSLSKELIRASLKRIESQTTCPYIIRCHRSYVVNLKQINSIKGNAQGYKIEFVTSSAKQVPVSRNYGKQLFERLEVIG